MELEKVVAKGLLCTRGSRLYPHVEDAVMRKSIVWAGIAIVLAGAIVVLVGGLSAFIRSWLERMPARG